jgi:VCBS repeat-containing protein
VTQDCMTAAGTLTVCDVDSGENHFQTPLSLAATYGEFAFDPNTGVWGYTLDNAAANVQALAPCQVVHDTLTVKSADGTACQQIDVTITGSEQPPAAVGDTSVATPTSFAGAALLTVIETVDQDKLYNFDFAHDQIDLIGYAGFTVFADVQTHLIEDANGNAVITLADGQSVLLESVRAMALKESNFVFEDNLIPGAGRLGNGELTLKNAGTIDATDTHALTIDTGSNFVFNSGVLEASGSGGMTGASAIVNSGFRGPMAAPSRFKVK